jgi:hypothetical protein
MNGSHINIFYRLALQVYSQYTQCTDGHRHNGLRENDTRHLRWPETFIFSGFWEYKFLENISGSERILDVFSNFTERSYQSIVGAGQEETGCWSAGDGRHIINKNNKRLWLVALVVESFLLLQKETERIAIIFARRCWYDTFCGSSCARYPVSSCVSCTRRRITMSSNNMTRNPIVYRFYNNVLVLIVFGFLGNAAVSGACPVFH